MTQISDEKLISLLGNGVIGALLRGGIICFFIKSFIPPYLSEKAKSLASKEDIENVGNRVESVKSYYAKVLEELRRNNQLKLAAIEREKNIKKEVYLAAVEAITRSQNIITSFHNLNIPNEKITSGMVKDSGIMAKIEIVGSKETVKAVTEFMTAIGITSRDLMFDRVVFLQRKETIEDVEALRSLSGREIDRYIQLMNNLNLEGNHDPVLWKTINDKIEFEQQQASKHLSSLDQLYTWIRQLNAVFCTNHLGQKELQKSLDAPSGCACVFLQPFASKAFA